MKDFTIKTDDELFCELTDRQRRKIEKLIAKVEKNHADESLVVMTHSNFIINQGRIFNTINKVIKKRVIISFNDIRFNKFPYISDKKVERYCRIANNITDKYLQDNPAISLLGQVQLLKLISLKKKMGIAEFLGDNNVDLNVTIQNPDHIRNFHQEINELIERFKTERSGKTSRTKKPAKTPKSTLKKKLVGEFNSKVRTASEHLFDVLESKINDEGNRRQVNLQIDQIIRNLKKIRNNKDKN